MAEKGAPWHPLPWGGNTLREKLFLGAIPHAGAGPEIAGPVIAIVIQTSSPPLGLPPLKSDAVG